MTRISARRKTESRGDRGRYARPLRMERLQSRCLLTVSFSSPMEFSAPSSSAQFAGALEAADMDGDGDLDLLSASREGNQIAWHANTADGSTFELGQVVSTSVDGPRSVMAVDLDRDGDLDVLAASAGDNTIAWYENMAEASQFGPQQIIATGVDGAQSAFAADLNGDGHLDVLSASNQDDTIAWYENGGGASGFGPQQVITADADGARSVSAADLDGDGDADVLSASQADNTIAWFENLDGAGTFGSRLVITNQAIGASYVSAADFDSDGRVDVLTASGGDNTIAWYRNTDVAGSFDVRRVVDDNVSEARSVIAADVDGDGDADILSSSLGGLQWYRNEQSSDHGDGADAATRVTLPTSVEGEILSPDDVDWFVFSAVEGMTYGIDTSLDTLADSTLRVFDSTGKSQLAFDDDGGQGLASRLVWRAASEADYFVEVAGHRKAVGTYKLHISQIGEDDQDNDAAHATHISVPSATAETVQVAGDVDWYVFSAAEGQTYTIETELNGLGDSILKLFDPDATVQLATDDDGGHGLASRLDWQAPASADHYVVVSGYGAAFGSYELHISRLGDESPIFLAGDSNRDGQFDQLDIVQVLMAAKYYSGQAAAWSEGDWNGDGRFDPLDIVAALQTGRYLQEPTAARHGESVGKNTMLGTGALDLVFSQLGDQ